MKKKIFIVINHDLYLSNFILSGAFRDLEKNYNCSYILDNKINNNNVKRILGKNYTNFKKKIIYRYSYNRYQLSLYNFLFSKIQFNNRKRFPNYMLSFKRYIKFKIFYSYDQKNLVLGIKRFILWSIKIFKIASYAVFSHKIFDQILKNFISKNSNLVKFFKKKQPNLVIIPSNGSHISTFDLIRYYKNLKQKKTFIISENWDNLYSRYMFHHPNYLSVWGESSIKQLKKHNYKEETLILGAPRLTKYFENRNKNLKKLYNFKYAVFFDIAYPKKIDNEIFLQNVDNFLEKNKKKNNNFKIIFRPHPYSSIKEVELIDFKKYKHIILDPQMIDRYNFNLQQSKVINSDFDYSVNLLKNSEFAIISTSSVIIEASIFRKKILIYSPKNNLHYPNSRLIDGREHVKEVLRFPNITLCDNENKIGYYFNLLMKKNKINYKKIDYHRNKILYSDNKSYSYRLCKEVSKILYKK